MEIVLLNKCLELNVIFMQSWQLSHTKRITVKQLNRSSDKQINEFNIICKFDFRNHFNNLVVK